MTFKDRYRQSLESNDKGLALPIVVFSLILFLIFVSFAVDLGLLYNARSHTQATADSAALAAAQELGDDAKMTDVARVVSNLNTSNAYLDEDFNTCVNDTFPAGFTPITGANCISVDSGRSAVRVRVPARELDTIFAQVVVDESFLYTATATAGIVSAGFGNVIPFGIPADGGLYDCLKAGSGSLPSGQCDGGNIGNYGYLNFTFFDRSCTGQANQILAEMVASGLDHDLSLYGGEPWGTTVTNERDSCAGGGTPPRPNAVDTETGNAGGIVGEGLMALDVQGTGIPGRLLQTDTSIQTTTMGGVKVDDTPLWSFLGDLSATTAPRSCWLDQFEGIGSAADLNPLTRYDNIPSTVQLHIENLDLGTQMAKLLERCFTHFTGQAWDDHGAITPEGEVPAGCVSADVSPVDGVDDYFDCDNFPIFTRNSLPDIDADIYDIQYSPRFAYVPRLHQDSTAFNGNTEVTFQRMEPIYLQRLLFKCNANNCDAIFDPGVGFSYHSHSTTVDAVTSLNFPRGMLPTALESDTAPFDIGANKFVILSQ